MYLMLCNSEQLRDEYLSPKDGTLGRSGYADSKSRVRIGSRKRPSGMHEGSKVHETTRFNSCPKASWQIPVWPQSVVAHGKNDEVKADIC